MLCTSQSLLLLLCIVHASNTTESTSRTENPQTLSIERSIETKSELKNLNKLNVSKYTDEDVENKVYPYKFSSTKPENATSIKLKKSESYTSTPELNNGSSRLENGRSVDIDIEKFISKDFYNAVYTPPISTKDHTSGYDTSQYGTENFGRLTTPSTPFFDKKYKEMVDSVNQKLEVDTDLENFTHAPNYTSDNFVEDIAKNPNGTKIAYKMFENIGGNETSKSGGIHKNVVLETQTILNIERKLNETTTYDETPSDGINEVHKENLKYLLGDEQANEVKKEEGSINNSPSLRTSFQLTTKKYSITKPSTDKNDAGIISNKIESDTLKSLITTTTPNSVVSKESSLEIQAKKQLNETQIKL
ncbi:hypothetical protein WA026_011502 [Henosepilachna vigintioctopunctata]|uniref:Uncharacterized protein n=1 Tax=Henosepilachna vigintioctopunctata TaxID=420089 RepID=A0AAW1TRC5_9CUCU